MGKFDINPFDRSALKEYRLLAGRVIEFRKVRFILRNSSKNTSRIKSILITGSRGVGKTSFLNLIENESIINNLIPIRINLTQSNSCNSNEFFWYLFNQTVHTLFSLNLLEGKGGSIDTVIQKILHGDGIKDEANWVFRTAILRRQYLLNSTVNFEFDLFAEDLKLIKSLIADSIDDRFDNKTKLIFLVDESQNIYSDVKIIQDIRFIIQKFDLGIGFVFAGDTTFESSTWEEVFGGSYRDFEVINLNYFTGVENVIEYFRKSLESIAWTKSEIEETLFYRFKLACRQIFQLTAGNPAWINTIASKMFERCMYGESSMLRFDRNAQNDVKQLLESSGQIDRQKLDYIDGLSIKYRKWLREIFSCELNALKNVYHYSKYKLIDEDFITLNEFESFSKSLVEEGIITFIDANVESPIGDGKPMVGREFLNRPYIAFNFNSDTIKQWLQITTEGKYQFSFDLPSDRYVSYINDLLATEKVNTVSIRSEGSRSFKLSETISNINSGTYDIEDVSYKLLSEIYKACKRFANSRYKQSLYVALENLVSEKRFSWNIYNYDDKDKGIDFKDSSKRIEKLVTTLESYNTEERKLSLEIVIEKLEFPSLKNLQSAILKSGDKKKFGIILDDKEGDLIDSYITQSDFKSSYEIALFFYGLFEEGYDLSVRNLNNSAYVFIVSEELDKATKMLNEASKIDLSTDLFDKETTDGGSDLVLYNLAIIDVKNGVYSQALMGFEKTLRFYETNQQLSGVAGVLQILDLDNNNEIKIKEIKEDNPNYESVNGKNFAKINIDILKKYLEL